MRSPPPQTWPAWPPRREGARRNTTGGRPLPTHAPSGRGAAGQPRGGGAHHHSARRRRSSRGGTVAGAENKRKRKEKGAHDKKRRAPPLLLHRQWADRGDGAQRARDGNREGEKEREKKKHRHIETATRPEQTPQPPPPPHPQAVPSTSRTPPRTTYITSPCRGSPTGRPHHHGNPTKVRCRPTSPPVPTAPADTTNEGQRTRAQPPTTPPHQPSHPRFTAGGPTKQPTSVAPRSAVWEETARRGEQGRRGVSASRGTSRTPPPPPPPPPNSHPRSPDKWGNPPLT